MERGFVFFALALRKNLSKLNKNMDESTKQTGKAEISAFESQPIASASNSDASDDDSFIAEGSISKTLHHYVVYQRVSTLEQARKDNPDLTPKQLEEKDIEFQDNALNAFLAKHPGQFVPAKLSKIVYHDQRSGTSLKGRIQFQKMMNIVKAKKGGVDTILVYSITRLARNYGNSKHILFELQDSKIHLIVINQPQGSEITTFDRPGFANDITFIINACFEAFKGAEFIQGLSSSSKQAVRTRIQRGIYYFGGHVAYGYDWIGKEPRYEPLRIKHGITPENSNVYVINEEKAKVVKKIFYYYVKKRYGVVRISQVLRRQNVKHQGPRNHQIFFTPACIAGILENPVYGPGEFTIQKTKNIGQRKLVSAKIYDTAQERALNPETGLIDPSYVLPEDEIQNIIDQEQPAFDENGSLQRDITIKTNTKGERIFPRIISDEMWEKAQKMRGEKSAVYFDGQGKKTRHELRIARARQHDHLLSGKLFCGGCGSPMYSKGKAVYIYPGKIGDNGEIIKNPSKRIGGYQSNCRMRGRKCHNSNFVSFAIDHIVWEALCRHISVGDLKDAIDAYWEDRTNAAYIHIKKEDVEQMKDEASKLTLKIIAIRETLKEFPDDPTAKQELAKTEAEKKKKDQEVKMAKWSLDSNPDTKRIEETDYLDKLQKDGIAELPNDVIEEEKEPDCVLGSEEETEEAECFEVGMGKDSLTKAPQFDDPIRGRVYEMGADSFAFRRELVLEFIRAVYYVHRVEKQGKKHPKRIVILYGTDDGEIEGSSDVLITSRGLKFISKNGKLNSVVARILPAVLTRGRG
jgi:DNA invertase Pin-like site-specific DNA recombinase